LASHLHALLAPAERSASAAELVTPATLVSALAASTASAGPALMALHIASRMPQLLPTSTSAAEKTSSGDRISTASLQRWDLDGLRDGVHVLRVRFGGFIAGVEGFDAAAFGITPPEAQLMDPQQRLLMEVRILGKNRLSYLTLIYSSIVQALVICNAVRMKFSDVLL